LEPVARVGAGRRVVVIVTSIHPSACFDPARQADLPSDGPPTRYRLSLIVPVSRLSDQAHDLPGVRHSKSDPGSRDPFPLSAPTDWRKSPRADLARWVEHA